MYIRSMSEKVKEYTNGEVTVVWKPERCFHSAKCVKGLPEVFKPKEKPWIKIDQASTEEIVDQCSKCPSGALSTYMNDEGKPQESSNSNNKAQCMPNGPLMVQGDWEIEKADGSTETKSGPIAFCRCGASNSKPFCDGTHSKVDFEG